MKQITVISGKGGTGKTSLVGAFAFLGQKVVLADCDVDAANLHLLICDPLNEAQSEPFISGVRAEVHPGKCTGCGWCENACRFDAIHLNGAAGDEGTKKAVVDLISCEGCGTCSDGCPESAVALKEHQAGDLLVTESRYGPLVHARLRPGEGSSGKLVTKVRTRAKSIADASQAEIVLIDGSPGIGCPVIASITGVDGVLVVTEPTLSGKSDLERILRLCRHFDVPVFVIVNKCDLNDEMTGEIDALCDSAAVPLLGRLRFDPAFVDAVVTGRTVMETAEDDTTRRIRGIWSNLLRLLKRGQERGLSSGTGGGRP